MSDTNGFQKKTDDLREQAEKLAKEGQVIAAEGEVEARKAALKEAEEHAEIAKANDNQAVALPQPGAEVVRTETLANAAREELRRAEDKLKAVKAGEQPSQQTPVSPAKVGTQGITKSGDLK
jgi:hypothetical protein